MRTIAASIAKEVFTGPMKLLEGPLGFCKNFSDDYDLEKITRNLGEDWMIMGIYFKKHASCSLSHTTMDATLGLADKYPVPIDQVEKVVVKTHRFPSDLNEKAPKTPSAAKASIPFCVSVALHQKRVSLNEFDSGTLENKNIQELARKVDVQLDPVLAGIHLAHEALRSSVLEVHLRSG